MAVIVAPESEDEEYNLLLNCWKYVYMGEVGVVTIYAHISNIRRLATTHITPAAGLQNVLKFVHTLILLPVQEHCTTDAFIRRK
jgi:hypothetical protein